MDKYRGRHWETELASGEPSDNKVSGERKKKRLLGFGGGSYQTVVTVEEEIKKQGWWSWYFARMLHKGG